MHLGQWMQSMQKGRCEPLTPGAQDCFVAAAPTLAHTLEESACMGSRTLDFMTMTGWKGVICGRSSKNALLADLPIFADGHVAKCPVPR